MARRSLSVRAASLTVLALLVIVPAVRLGRVTPDDWVERLRAGVLGAVAVSGLAAVVFAGGYGAIRRSPLARPALVLLLGLSLSTLFARVPVLGLVETARFSVLLVAALLASLAAGAVPAMGRQALAALAMGSVLGLALGSLENRNDLGTLAAAGLVAALATRPFGWRERALALLFLALLVHSGTRAAMLAAALAGLLGLAWRGAGPRRLALALLAVLVAAGGALWLVPRLRPDLVPLRQSAGHRLELWRVAAELGSERPLLGHGPGSFRAEAPGRLAGRSPLFALDTHCDPLQAFAETGVVGLAALVLLMASALAAWRPAELEPWRLALVAALLHSLVHLVLHASAPAAATFVAAGLVAPSPWRAEPGSARAPSLLLAPVFAALLLVAIAPAMAAISLGRMERAWRAQDWDQAAVEATRALRFDPARPEAVARLAEIHLLAEHWREGLELAERGLALAPYDPTLRLRAGQAAYFLGQRDRARAELGEAMRLAPASDEVREWLERATRPVAERVPSLSPGDPARKRQ